MINKIAFAALSASVVWLIAYMLGTEPRPLDWWILFSIDYTGLSLVAIQRGARG